LPCITLPDIYTKDEKDVEEEWVPDEDVSTTLRAKILALKVCRNRSLAHASSDKALEISAPVLKMFATLLEHNGSFSAKFSEDEEYAHLGVLGPCEVADRRILARKSSPV
jgi:hypothetical protein